MHFLHNYIQVNNGYFRLKCNRYYVKQIYKILNLQLIALLTAEPVQILIEITMNSNQKESDQMEWMLIWLKEFDIQEIIRVKTLNIDINPVTIRLGHCFSRFYFPHLRTSRLGNYAFLKLSPSVTLDQSHSKYTEDSNFFKIFVISATKSFRLCLQLYNYKYASFKLKIKWFSIKICV